MIHCAPDIGLALEPNWRRRRSLLLGQTVHPVIHDDIGHLDIFARGVIEMISADGKRIAVTSEYEDMQIGPRMRNPARKLQRPPMNVVRPVRLHEIRKAA